jgi:hypothetical protein
VTRPGSAFADGFAVAAVVDGALRAGAEFDHDHSLAQDLVFAEHVIDVPLDLDHAFGVVIATVTRWMSTTRSWTIWPGPVTVTTVVVAPAVTITLDPGSVTVWAGCSIVWQVR